MRFEKPSLKPVTKGQWNRCFLLLNFFLFKNYQRSKKTIHSLRMAVRVPPVRTRIVRFDDVGELGKPGNRTLADKSCAIHPEIINHVKPMPVECKPFVGQFVSYPDTKNRALFHFDIRPGELAIYCYYSSTFLKFRCV